VSATLGHHDALLAYIGMMCALNADKPAEPLEPRRRRKETSSDPMKSVWVYFATEAQGDKKPDLTIFETEELARRWLAVKDPKGVAFEYPVEDEEAASGT
jgi:hypothetical protein